MVEPMHPSCMLVDVAATMRNATHQAHPIPYGLFVGLGCMLPQHIRVPPCVCATYTSMLISFQPTKKLRSLATLGTGMAE